MDKCPFCGANQDTDSGSRYIYQCRSEASGRSGDALIIRSHICYESERSHLRTENHTLKGDLYKVKARLRDALGLLQTLIMEAINYSAMSSGTYGKVKDFLDKGSTEPTP